MTSCFLWSVLLIAVVGLFSLAAADVSEIVGKNQYLPPSKGYHYDRPSIPFPSSPAPRPSIPFQSSPAPRPSIPFPSSPAPRPNIQYPSSPAPRPTPGYQTPFPARPTYQPPTPSYQPPVAPSYVPPVTPRPVSRPLPAFQQRPNAVYQPGPSSSGNQGNFIGPSGGGDAHDHHHHHEPGMPYDFEYKVKDDYFGTDYYRNEVSDGDLIKGEYRVQLPDGRIQIVKYTADWKNGFNAEVSYQGQPNFPGGSGAGAFPSGGSRSPNAYIPPAPSSRF